MFEVGERVYIVGAWSHYDAGKIAVVARVTKGGKAEVDGQLYNPDGLSYGGPYSAYDRKIIRKLTPELEDKALAASAVDATIKILRGFSFKAKLTRLEAETALSLAERLREFAYSQAER
jgi:hypothetical protein